MMLGTAPRTSARILVTDTQERAGLAVARCLRSAGYSVTAVASSRMAPGLWSRSASRRRVITGPASDADGFVAGLRRILEAEHHALLVPVTDDSLLAISRRRDWLTDLVPTGLPAADAVERALSREALGPAAATAGLPAPEGRVCAGAPDALAAARDLGLPVLVKPAATVTERDGRTVRGFSRLALDAGQVAAAAEILGRCIVQRHRTGRVVSFAGVAAPDGLAAYAVSRYVRTWPVRAGNVSSSETVAPPPGLVAAVETFVRELGWRGMFELELIDSGSSPGGGAELAAIDFNPRAYGSLSLAVAAGAPLPAVWAALCLGPAPDRVAARPGVRYRWEDADLRHALWQLWKGHRVAALAAARPHRGTAHAYFRRDDPGPVLARGWQLWREERGQLRRLAPRTR